MLIKLSLCVIDRLTLGKRIKTTYPEAEFKEYEPRLKYGWFHLKPYSIFQDLSRRLIETGYWQI